MGSVDYDDDDGTDFFRGLVVVLALSAPFWLIAAALFGWL